ncbi:MAG: acyl-CoA dehydrogenase [Deltaproteobacteria bacterium]|nr:acyl-CoA dehydrogenase [Deltaproteobacteria bacterium]
MKLKAEQDADGTWRLNGVKRFITNGGAEVLLVLARSEAGTTDGLGLSLFLCEGGDTVTVRRLEDKLGIHGSPTCELGFDNTPAYLIGERQRGLVTYVLTLLNGARLATAAQAIGIAQAAFDEARAYARVRKQYGRRIEVLPPVAEMLTTMKISIEGARALNYETALIADLSVGIARKMEQGGLEPVEKKKFRKDAKKYERLSNLLTSLTKYYGSEMSNRVTHDAMQVLGGSGYMRDYPVEKYYRDARITNIYEGTSQMQVVSAFRGILSGTLEKYFEELSAQEYPRRQGALARRLLQARKLLSQAVEHLNTDRNAQIMDLAARTVVDMGTDILIGYLFLKQSLHAPRKLTIASLFIKTMLPVLQMRLRRVKAEDSSCLKQFAVIVDQA